MKFSKYIGALAALMLMHSPVYATDEGLTWTIPNTEDGGTASNPGADWFNADTSISTLIPFSDPVDDSGTQMFDVDSVSQYTATSPSTPNEAGRRRSATSRFGATRSTEYVPYDSSEGYSGLSSPINSESIVKTANVIGAFESHSFTDDEDNQNGFEVGNTLGKVKPAPNNTPYEITKIEGGFEPLGNTTNSKVLVGMDASSSSIVNQFNFKK